MKKQTIETITPFSNAVWDKVMEHVRKGSDPEIIQDMITKHLAQFNAVITEQQDAKLALEVVERLGRGQTMAHIMKDPHMPPERVIRNAINNCQEAKDRLMAMNRLTRKNIVHQAIEALSQLAELSTKPKVTADDKLKVNALKIFTEVTGRYIKDGLLTVGEEKSSSGYLGLMEGVSTATKDEVAKTNH